MEFSLWSRGGASNQHKGDLLCGLGLVLIIALIDDGEDEDFIGHLLVVDLFLLIFGLISG